MATQRRFQETDVGALAALVRTAPLASLILHDDAALSANHVPFVLRGHLGSADVADAPVLQAHVPRSSPLAQRLSQPRPALAIFHGPQGYVSPSFYATKAEHGNVVPTWNYAVAHVYGSARTVDDPEWVLRQMNQLTDENEQDRPVPWSVSDASDEFIQRLTSVLVGIEIRIERVEGTTKASQNQPVANQQSVLEALDREASGSPMTRWMHDVLEPIDS